MKKYLIIKASGKLLFEIATLDVDFTSSTEHIIETSIVPAFYLNKWNGATWIEMATELQIIQFEKDKIPQNISKMNLRIQLILQNINLSSITEIISMMPDAVERNIVFQKWESAVYFERDNATLNQMATLLGITSKQLDTIFINGSKM
jgi:hypothetical protein